MMPNKPRPENRHRMVRVEDDLWEAARVACEKLGTTRSNVMREALQKVVKKAPRNTHTDIKPAVAALVAPWPISDERAVAWHQGIDAAVAAIDAALLAPALALADEWEMCLVNVTCQGCGSPNGVSTSPFAAELRAALAAPGGAR